MTNFTSAMVYSGISAVYQTRPRGFDFLLTVKPNESKVLPIEIPKSQKVRGVLNHGTRLGPFMLAEK